jgi:hypothetical protein
MAMAEDDTRARSGRDEDDDEKRAPQVRRAWTEIATTVAATALFLYVLGGAVLWIRFGQGGVPAARAVALVPSSRLVVTALSGFVLPLIVLLLVFTLTLWSAHRMSPARWGLSRRRRVALLGVAWFVVGVLLAPPSIVGLGLWLVLSASAAFIFGTGLPLRTPFPWFSIAASAAVTSAAVLLLIETQKPPKLEPVQALLNDGPTVRGVFITQTGEALYVGQHHAIVAVPNARLRLVRIGPTPQFNTPRPLLWRWLDGIEI